MREFCAKEGPHNASGREKRAGAQIENPAPQVDQAPYGTCRPNDNQRHAHGLVGRHPGNIDQHRQRHDRATAAKQAQAQANERRQHKSEREHLQRAG